MFYFIFWKYRQTWKFRYCSKNVDTFLIYEFSVSNRNNMPFRAKTRLWSCKTFTTCRVAMVSVSYRQIGSPGQFEIRAQDSLTRVCFVTELYSRSSAVNKMLLCRGSRTSKKRERRVKCCRFRHRRREIWADVRERVTALVLRRTMLQLAKLFGTTNVDFYGGKH